MKNTWQQHRPALMGPGGKYSSRQKGEMVRLMVASVLVWSCSGTVALRGQESAALTREELERALQERDAMIAELLRRVEVLERARVGAVDAQDVPAVAIPVAKPPAPAARTNDVAVAPPAPEEPAQREIAQTQAPAPGQFEIDEGAAERALDFILVQEGALLLPAGQAEFTPSFSYTRRTVDFPIIVNPGPAGLLGEQEVRRNEFDLAANFRIGLPFDSQLEFALPYNIVDQSSVNRVGGNEVRKSSGTGHGLGNFSIGAAKTLLRQKHWWPDVIARLNWDTGTGDKTDNDVVLDGGFQSVSGALTFTERQDPLVFVGGAAYETVFEDDDVDPGDTLSFSIGTVLAASPSTSLRLVLDQSFVDELKVDGQSIDGSDQVQSMLTLGASAILGRNILLDGAVAVGLTDDSPDYAVSVALPIRFNPPLP